MNELHVIDPKITYCYSNNTVYRAYKLEKGDIFTLRQPTQETLDPIKSSDRFMIEIIYESKKWWQFWEKRKIFEYRIMCVK